MKIIWNWFKRLFMKGNNTFSASKNEMGIQLSNTEQNTIINCIAGDSDTGIYIGPRQSILKSFWNWLERRFYHINGRVKRLSWLYISIPIAVGLFGNHVLNSYSVWGLGIGLQLLSIALLVTGSRKYQHS